MLIFCHCLVGWSPASHIGDTGSIPDQAIWDLWCTKWHYDRVISWNCNSTNAPYSCSSIFYSYRKDKRARPEYFKKKRSKVVLEVWYFL